MRPLWVRLATAWLLGSCGGTAVIDGEGGPDCLGMERDYQDALARAKACSLSVDENPCVEKAAGGLTPCDGCSTMVNAENVEALQELAELSNEYNRAGCAERPVTCPDIGCVNATAAICAADLGAVQCVDMR